MQNWIKCSERMPEIGTSVLMYRGYGVIAGYYTSNKYAKTEKGRLPRFESFNGIQLGVTHWQPFPEPPQE